MPLDRLIDLLAEAAVRKLSQKREKKDATPDAMNLFYFRLRPYDVLNSIRYIIRVLGMRRDTKTRRP